MTQKNFATKAGCTKEHFNAILNQRTSAGKKLAKSIASIMGNESEWVIWADEEMGDERFGKWTNHLRAMKNKGVKQEIKRLQKQLDS